MMKRYTIFCCGMLFLFIFATIAGALQTDSSHRLYLEAKKRSFNQDWDVAAQLYEQLVKEYPESHYREEAQFWVGYCLEKAGDAHSAYLAFNALEQKFPTSTWLDDAVQHKIGLAEKLATQRGDQYYVFLRTQLENEDKDIRFQAAMALGRLRDRRALPTLQDLRGHVDFDSETETIISTLEQAEDLPDEVLYAEGSFGENDQENRATRRINPKDERINYFAEHRFKQYESMTRTDDKWSHEELMNFGLWHIMPSDSFDSYRNLEPAAKSQWLRIFWKKQDPTPTTDINEGKEEFEYRVNFARQYFSYYDGLENFHYAPWDARGEIYIKFGQPQNRTKADDGEFWYYPSPEKITFYIRPNVTNIFGRAIVISSLDGRSMRSVPRRSEWRRWRYFHTLYIFNPGFYNIYKLPEGYAALNDLRIKRLADGPGVRFEYSIPASQFDIFENNGLSHLSYVERYVIFDNEMHKVAGNETKHQVTKANKRDLRKLKTIEQEINIDLAPGDYMLGLRIEDQNSKKIGIKKIQVNIQ